MIGHWWLCGRKFSQPIAKRYKKIWSPSKKIFLGSGSTVYTMDNNDTNTDCQKVVRVGGQKWEIVEITVRISFFCLRFVFTTSYTGSFQVPPEKITPSQSANSHQKSQFDLSPSYIKLLRNGSTTPPQPPITQGGAGWRCELCIW